MSKFFHYATAFSRNIGWITETEQEVLRNKRVAIAGLGGVGGSHLLTLTRLGIGKFNISDLDIFEYPFADGNARHDNDEFLESALNRMESLLKAEYGISGRAVSLLLLQGDSQIEEMVKKQEASVFPQLQAIIAEARANHSQPLDYIIAFRRKLEAERILSGAVTLKEKSKKGLAENRLSP